MKSYRLSLYSLLAAATLLIMAACASIGTPTGGPRDETPPRLVKANPVPGAVNVDKKSIVLEFDEIVNVKDAFSNVVVSPTSASTPRVTSMGRKVTVSFTDTLMENTTYSIDFANSIQDNNEGNALENFTYTFATGPEIDTLRISGIVLDSRTLEPQQHIVVGIHSEVADTTFRTTRLMRIAKTDDRGRFSIRGVKEGSYHIFALADINNDYRWDNPEEDIAFREEAVVPSAHSTIVADTIFNLVTATPDSVVSRVSSVFLPNDILLSSFNVGYKPQYLATSARVDSTRLNLFFNAKAPTLPEVRIIDHPTASDWAVVERSANNDSVTYWLRDKNLLRADTLTMEVKYLRNKAMGVFEEATDTIPFIIKKMKGEKPKKKKNENDSVAAPEIKFLAVNDKGGGTQEVYLPKYLEFDTPLESFDPAKFHLQYKKDTVWTPIDGVVVERADTLNPRRYKVEHKWDYGTSYRLSLDSIAVVDIYGLFNKPVDLEFKTRSEEDYCQLTFDIVGIRDTIPVMVELLNSSDTPVRAVARVKGKAVFSYLSAGTYFARLYEDVNGNGVYDTGDYDLRLQPESTSYYPKKIDLKKNWDLELTWDVNALPVDRQKPDKIKKNKPSNDKRKKAKEELDEEEEDEEDSSPFGGGSNSFSSPGSGRSNRI